MTDQSHRKADPEPTKAERTVTPTAEKSPAQEKPKHGPDAKPVGRSLQDKPEEY